MNEWKIFHFEFIFQKKKKKKKLITLLYLSRWQKKNKRTDRILFLFLAFIDDFSISYL